MALIWKSGYSFDSDASTYIDAVEATDGQALETGVRVAINDFVLGCKQDDIWNAIKASCILAGARTIDGALVPLTGTAPTNNNFVGADYDRETGLKGDGSTKHLDSNRANNADPQDDKHLSVYQTSLATSDSILIGTENVTGRSALISFVAGGTSVRINSKVQGASIGNSVGFVGGVRSSSSTSTGRANGTNFLQSIASQSPATLDIGVFAEASGIAKTDARISFYSIGESLDLAKLDTRVSNLMTAIGAALP